MLLGYYNITVVSVIPSYRIRQLHCGASCHLLWIEDHHLLRDTHRLRLAMDCLTRSHWLVWHEVCHLGVRRLLGICSSCHLPSASVGRWSRWNQVLCSLCIHVMGWWLNWTGVFSSQWFSLHCVEKKKVYEYLINYSSQLISIISYMLSHP